MVTTLTVGSLRKKYVHSTYILRSLFPALIWTIDTRFFTAFRPWYIALFISGIYLIVGLAFLLQADYQSMPSVVSNLFTHCHHLQISGTQDFSWVLKALVNCLIAAITCTVIVESLIMKLQGGPVPAWLASGSVTLCRSCIVCSEWGGVTVGYGMHTRTAVMITFRKFNETHQFYIRHWKFCPPDRMHSYVGNMLLLTGVLPPKLLNLATGVVSSFFQQVTLPLYVRYDDITVMLKRRSVQQDLVCDM